MAKENPATSSPQEWEDLLQAKEKELVESQQKVLALEGQLQTSTKTISEQQVTIAELSEGRKRLSSRIEVLEKAIERRETESPKTEKAVKVYAKFVYEGMEYGLTTGAILSKQGKRTAEEIAQSADLQKMLIDSGSKVVLTIGVAEGKEASK